MIKDLVGKLPIIWLYRLIYYMFYCAAILRFCNGHTRSKSTCFHPTESPKRGLYSAVISSLVKIQREAFSGFSMRNRDILEKEPSQRQSNREKSQKPERRVAAENRGPTRFQKPERRTTAALSNHSFSAATRPD
jgi:hypothetical protein